jgi:hypothetical protein
MLLDVGEDHFYGSHAELVRTEEHDWEAICFVLADDPSAPMVGCVVQGNDSLEAPVPILLVETRAELEQEIPEALLIVIAKVDGVV